jgi:two-component system cell cycle sensor histidine kinase/response regulator CckA
MQGLLQFADGTSEKVRLEQKLIDIELRYWDLFENASDCIYVYDDRGYFMEVNRTALKMLGCTKNEIIGTNISEWITPESLKLTQENLKKCIQGEPVKQPMVMEVICRNGDHRLMEVKRRLVRDGDRIIAVHGIGRDITEKRKLELKLEEYNEKLKKSYEKLRESEARYRDIFENALDAMYILDIEGIVLKMNKVGLRILGCAEEEVTGYNISKWLTSESAQNVEERRKKLLSGEKLDPETILEIVCKNGEHRWVEIRARKIREIKGKKEIHGVARDITENVLLKKELKKSDKQRKLLCYLIKGTRGGKTRAIILRHLIDRSYNAHQLAMALNMDYKTIRHHLRVLIDNGMITKRDDGNTAVYFLSEVMAGNLNTLDQ